MPRIGKNPLKIQTLPVHPRITAAVITFLPSQSGYFERRLEAIRLSLTSLVRHAEVPIDLMVFDNGSCAELIELLLELKAAGLIQQIILNACNVGKGGAIQVIAGAAQTELLTIADDDVYYFPGWLQPQLDILDGLPDVGLVSGAYLRGTHPRSVENARAKGLNVFQRVAPPTWMREFCHDATYASAESYYRAQEPQGWTDLDDMIVEKNGVEAYCGGVCWQATFRTETLRALMPRTDPKESGYRSYDGFLHDKVLRDGYLRLSTPERHVRHIGNVISTELHDLAREHNLVWAQQGGIRRNPVRVVASRVLAPFPVLRRSFRTMEQKIRTALAP